MRGSTLIKIVVRRRDWRGHQLLGEMLELVEAAR